ncbi:MAG TPA: transcription antitermination factor NusB [Candidatus Gracilibacteria bacterium]
MSDKAARRESRIMAVEALFYHLERPEKPWEECFDFVLKDLELKKADDFSKSIVSMAVEHLGKIKVIIKAFAPQFPYEKIAPINRVLLVLGITEMKFIETPPVVVINEYVEIAKIFGEDKSASFLNGVLDNYRKGLGLEGRKKPDA